MPWILFAVIVWLFLVLIFRMGGIKSFWSAGIWSFLVFFFLNEAFVGRGLYAFNKIFYELEGIPLAFLVAVTGIGIITIRFLPAEKWWQAPYLIIFALGLSVLELFALENGYIIYLEWSFYNGFFFKLLALIAIVWLSSLTVRRRTEYFFR